MAIVGMHHFNLRAPESELVVLERFYCDVLGFQVGPRPSFQSLGTWLYADGVPLLHLTQMNSGEVVSPGAPEHLPTIAERFSSVDHIALAANNLQATLQRLRECNVLFTQAEVPAVGEVQLFFRDPSGNGIELIFKMEDCCCDS